MKRKKQKNAASSSLASAGPDEHQLDLDNYQEEDASTMMEEAAYPGDWLDGAETLAGSETDPDLQPPPICPACEGASGCSCQDMGYKDAFLYREGAYRHHLEGVKTKRIQAIRQQAAAARAAAAAGLQAAPKAAPSRP